MYTPPEYARHEFGRTVHIIRQRYDTGWIDTECHKRYGPNVIADVAKVVGSKPCSNCANERAWRLKKKVYTTPVLYRETSKLRRDKFDIIFNWQLVRRQEIAKWAKFTGQEPSISE